MRYKQGEIVLVPFPYSDLSGSKRRPVLIVSNDLYMKQKRPKLLKNHRTLTDVTQKRLFLPAL